ncbi:MAG: undecaprenyl-diphosphate phosphatase, partial [Oscillospiraceae bacterium]|nr:undecaprenyl-diphosphate phosphatase [Oscillospiraceae bacterium]
FDRAFAVRFSFLLSLPAVLGATLLELFKALRPAEGAVAVALPLGPCLAGALVAAVSGYFALGFLKKLVSKGRFGGFVYYCLIVGAIAIMSSFFLN